MRLRELHGLWRAFAGGDQILREPDAWPSSARQRAAGQHHVHHAGGADHAAAAAPSRRRRRRCRAGLGQRVDRPCVRRRGCARRRRVPGRRRPPRRAARRPPARCRTRCASKARCQDRECSTPAKMSRSVELGEIEPGAEMLAFAGQHDRADLIRQRREEAPMPRTVSSSRALRLAARLSRNTATAPWRSAFKVGGRSANSDGEVVIGAI